MPDESAAETRVYRRVVRADREATLAALDEAAEMWSAAWKAAPEGGELHLPVLAGVRRGRMLARVDVRPLSEQTEVELRIEVAEYEVNRPALVFLILGALGALVILLLPWFPKQLIAFLPLAGVLMIGAWLAVASRLRSAGPDAFLDDAAELAEYREPPVDPSWK